MSRGLKVPLIFRTALVQFKSPKPIKGRPHFAENPSNDDSEWSSPNSKSAAVEYKSRPPRVQFGEPDDIEERERGAGARWSFKTSRSRSTKKKEKKGAKAKMRKQEENWERILTSLFTRRVKNARTEMPTRIVEGTMVIWLLSGTGGSVGIVTWRGIRGCWVVLDDSQSQILLTETKRF